MNVLELNSATEGLKEMNEAALKEVNGGIWKDVFFYLYEKALENPGAGGDTYYEGFGGLRGPKY